MADPTPAFGYINGWLCTQPGGVDLDRLAAEVGTPCYVYSLDRALHNLARLRAAFPEADIHYSLKANANLALLRALCAAGAGADAVSGGEVFRALQAGIAPEHIVFAGVGKTAAELAYALESRVGWINVESAGELARLAQIAYAKGVRPRVALRLNPDVQADTHHYIATGHAAAKFGIAPADAERLLAARAEYADLDIAGLHIHIGSQLGTVERTVEAVRAVLPFFERFPSLHTLDLGGGFPVSYTGDPVPPPEAFADAIRPLLRDRPVRLILEPGRYIIADTGLLLVEVQYLKPARDGVIVVTDGGMTELIRPALYGATHGVLPLRENADAEPIRAHVVGPVCESADILRADVLLPPLQAGDRLAISHVGAYGAVMGSTYNARPRPPEVLIDGAAWEIVRRRETWDDLIRLEK